MVRKGLIELPYIINVALPENAKSVIENSDVIMVGGGNTFKLLHDIYSLGLLDVIRDKVNGGAPYIGWSAGSNVTGPTIGTTNDMPIIEPKSFNALGLLPFQINPHYINQNLQGHNGETRDERLREFVKLNPGVPVVGLPEGAALQLQSGVLTFIGAGPGVLFRSSENEEGDAQSIISVGEDISWLL
jgi:dipeptidase E